MRHHQLVVLQLLSECHCCPLAPPVACRYLLLILMDAERAWSYAMQLKQEANTEPRKRFHLLSRLRKAVKHAEELERLCESNRVDAKTKLEAQVATDILVLLYSKG